MTSDREPITRPRPRFWTKLPVVAGNLLQLAGMLLGLLLIVASGAIRSSAAVSVLLSVPSWLSTSAATQLPTG